MNEKQNTAKVEAFKSTIKKQTEIITKAYANYQQNESAGAQYIYEMGKALTAVRDAYKNFCKKNTTKMFETYCKEECGFSKAYGYFLIRDAKVQDKLEKWGLTKVKQGDHQLRILAHMDDNELKKIWKKVTGGDKKKYVMEYELPHYENNNKVQTNSAAKFFNHLDDLIRHVKSWTKPLDKDEAKQLKELMQKCLDAHRNKKTSKKK